MFRKAITAQKNNRIPEIDMIRGIAIILMVIYHVFFDLNSLGIYTLPLMITQLFWNFLSKPNGIMNIQIISTPTRINFKRKQTTKSISEATITDTKHLESKCRL